MVVHPLGMKLEHAGGFKPTLTERGNEMGRNTAPTSLEKQGRAGQEEESMLAVWERLRELLVY